MNKEYKIGSKVIMKKPHPCGTNLWEVTRVGVDIKIKCIKCGKMAIKTNNRQKHCPECSEKNKKYNSLNYKNGR